MGYKSASSASEKGVRAFESATKYLVQNMLRSISKKLEVELMYGQSGLGVVSAVSTTQVTIVLAEWAPGIWAGSEKMPINIRNSTGVTDRGNFVISSVNMDTRVLTLTTDAAAAGVVATDVIYPKGAFGNEFAGLHKILTNTGSLFNISAASYALWRANEFSAGSAALSFQKLQDAIARGVEKGLDSDVKVIVNPKTWADLLNEQSALRRYDSSYSSDNAKVGAKKIEFHGQSGLIEIVPSIYCKEGYAYVIDPDTMLRVGSSDITFKRPGRGDEFFRDLDGHAAYELRAYTDQALFCNAIGRNILITNIVN